MGGEALGKEHHRIAARHRGFTDSFRDEKRGLERALLVRNVSPSTWTLSPAPWAAAHISAIRCGPIARAPHKFCVFSRHTKEDLGRQGSKNEAKHSTKQNSK